MSSLRVTFFAAYSRPFGTYFRWHNLARGLHALGHQVTVRALGPAAWKGSQTEIRDGVCYHLIPATPILHRIFREHLDPVALWRAVFTQSDPCDVFHVFQPFPSSCLPALAQRHQAKCLVYDWDDQWTGGIWPKSSVVPARANWVPLAVRLFERGMPGWVDGVTSCSTYLADKAEQLGGRNTCVIHNGFWADQSCLSVKEAREKLGLDPEAFYFGFMGRALSELEWCLDALADGTSSGVRPRLALCGMPASEVDALPPEFRSRIDYCGILSSEDARHFARAIDCGLLPLENSAFNQSRFPVKFAEYLAAGTHVVASAVGEIARIGETMEQVTLAGTSRQSWSQVFFTRDFPRLLAHKAETGSLRSNDLMDWMSLAHSLAEFYLQRLQARSSLGAVRRSELLANGGCSEVGNQRRKAIHHAGRPTTVHPAKFCIS